MGCWIEPWVFRSPICRAWKTPNYLQDALIRCLEVLGEATKRLSQNCRDRHPEVPWRAMAGMRDLLIHAYDRVDLEEVWEAYRQFAWLRDQIAAMVDAPTE